MAKVDPNHVIISRKEAIALGLKVYFTGKSCKRGHIAQRGVAASMCRECARLALALRRKEDLEGARKRDRDWRKNNPEKAKAKDRLEYIKYKDRKKAALQKRIAANPRYIAEVSKRYTEGHLEETRERSRKNSARYRVNYPQKAKDAVDLWWKNNKHKKKVYHRNRKARKRGNGGTHTAADVADIRKRQKDKCAYCRVPLSGGGHVDHIMPLIKGGTNARKNLQLLCEPCNLAKGARDPIDHAQSLGLLL